VKTAAQIALEVAAEREREKYARIVAEQEAKNALEKKRASLLVAIEDALLGFAGMSGLTVNKARRSITLSGGQTFVVRVDFVPRTTWQSGDPPQTTHEDCVVRWSDQAGEVFGNASTVEQFHEEFGRFIGQYL
jgi:hypothetical protein